MSLQRHGDSFREFPRNGSVQVIADSGGHARQGSAPCPGQVCIRGRCVLGVCVLRCVVAMAFSAHSGGAGTRASVKETLGPQMALSSAESKSNIGDTLYINVSLTYPA